LRSGDYRLVIPQSGDTLRIHSVRHPREACCRCAGLDSDPAAGTFSRTRWPRPAPNPWQIMQKLEDRTALFILLWNDASVVAMDTAP
jgi:hypothetical protein